MQDGGTSELREGGRGALPSIRVLVADDHPLIREGVAAMLVAEGDMDLVGEADNGPAAIDAYRKLRPDVTLLDLQMPGIDGLDVLTAIRREDNGARVVILTTYAGDAQAARAVELGARGYLLKSGFRRELIQTIRAVHAGGRHIAENVASALAFSNSAERLTDKEIDILKLVADGFANRSIGQQLQVSEDTVKARLKNIYVKLNAADRAHAVAIAIKRGLLGL